MNKYAYRAFEEKKQIAQMIRESYPLIQRMGCDAEVFYETLIQHPEILLIEDKEEALNELLGWIPDAAKAGLNAVKGIGAGWRAKNRGQDADFLRQLQQTDPAEFARRGYTQAHIDQSEKEKHDLNQTSKRGFSGNVSQGWNQARLDRKHDRLQGRFGIGPYGPYTPPTTNTQNPTTPPLPVGAAPGSSASPAPGTAPGSSAPPTPGTTAPGSPAAPPPPASNPQDQQKINDLTNKLTTATQEIGNLKKQLAALQAQVASTSGGLPPPPAAATPPAPAAPAAPAPAPAAPAAPAPAPAAPTPPAAPAAPRGTPRGKKGGGSGNP